VILPAVFPEAPLEDTPWQGLWREQEDRTILHVTRVLLVLTATVVVAHWFFVDPAIGLTSPRWFAYRFGSAGLYLFLLALTFSSAFHRAPLVRLPLLVLALAIGTLQAKSVQWAPSIVYIWAFAVTVPPLVFLRMSALSTVAALVACVGVQWLVAWRNTAVPPASLVSWAAASAIIAVAARARMALDVRSFVAEKRELDAQKKLIETQIELDRVKTNFFTNVSHELRTPLTLIVAPLEAMLAAGRAVPRELRGELQLMHRNAERLLRHINALLHLSRLDAKREFLKLEEVDAAELLRALVDSGRALAQKRHIEVRFDAEENLPRVPLDREKVEQIALNLLGNALRFTDGTEIRPGHVTLRCGVRGALFFFEVEDDGVGVPPDDLHKIFDRFHQVAGHAARGGGTGIGLALVKELTEFHMGSVSVRSRIGRGSTFTVELPLDPSVYPPDRLDRRQDDIRPSVERRRPVLRPRLELVSATDPLGPSRSPPRPTPVPAPADRADGLRLADAERSLQARERAVAEKDERLAKVSFDLVLSKRQVLLETMEAFALAVDAKDPYAQGHSRRVAILAERVARELALSEKDQETVRIAGILHDVGKIGTPESVLVKPGRLDPEEYELFKRHAVLGYRIVSAVKELELVGKAILHHHERFDGNGYPEGLAGGAIPPLSRILAVCDTYDAMTTDRPYRTSLGHAAAVEELARCAGGQLDPDAVHAFLRLYRNAAPTYPTFPSGLRELAGMAVPAVEP
jgi:putative nucleotidyltransferase with HDIG domain